MSINREEQAPFNDGEELLPPNEVRGQVSDPVEMPDARFKDGQKFAFDKEVAEDFENKVISKQIPGYQEMRFNLLNIALATYQKDGIFLDLGTSNGRMIRDFVVAKNEAAKNCNEMNFGIEKFYGLDIEDDMLEKAGTLFSDLREEVKPRHFNYVLQKHDLRDGIPFMPNSVSVATSIFTIQFVPPEHRQKILTEIYESLKPGAPFIWAEKVISRSRLIDDKMTQVYYEHKSRNGIDDETIRIKRESLEGNLMPFTSRGNIELLESAGFESRNIDLIWKNLQFEAYIAIK